VTAAASLGVGIVAMGVVGLLGAGWLGYWIPRRVPRPQADRIVGGASAPSPEPGNRT